MRNTQYGSPITRDPLIPRNYFDINWKETGYRDGHPSGPQLFVQLWPGRWINDNGAVVNVPAVDLTLAIGTNCIQLDRATGAVVADATFNPGSIPLWLVTTEGSYRIDTAMDLRGLPGVPGGV